LVSPGTNKAERHALLCCHAGKLPTVLLLKLIDPAADLDTRRTVTRVEGVAVGADFDTDVLPGGDKLIGRSAATVDARLLSLRMNTSLHFKLTPHFHIPVLRTCRRYRYRDVPAEQLQLLLGR
jgi:hypothetical protein